MRLSDAIALGRTLKSPMPGTLGLDSVGAPGCAMGMAHVAAGNMEPMDVYKLWPWVKTVIPLPCGCDRCGYSDGVNGAIAHIFDCHVFYKQDWTLDQLIDWVRSVEPAEQPESSEAITERLRSYREVGCANGRF